MEVGEEERHRGRLQWAAKEGCSVSLPLALFSLYGCGFEITSEEEGGKISGFPRNAVRFSAFPLKRIGDNAAENDLSVPDNTLQNHYQSE